MKRILLILLAAFLLQSCSESEGKRPEIKKEQLVDVLFDIHLTDGYLTYKGYRVDRNRDKIESAYGYVLDKHNITPKQFHNTMKYYSKHISEYEKLYNKVIEKLTKYEGEMMKASESNNSAGKIQKPSKIG